MHCVCSLSNWLEVVGTKLHLLDLFAAGKFCKEVTRSGEVNHMPNLFIPFVLELQLLFEIHTISKIKNVKSLSVHPSVSSIATLTINMMTMTGLAPVDANGPPLLAPEYPTLPKLTSTEWVTPPPSSP